MITDHICEEKSFIGFGAGNLEHTLTSLNFSKYMQPLEDQAERAWFQYRMIVVLSLLCEIKAQRALSIEDPNRNQTRFSGFSDLLFNNLGLSVG